MLRGFLFSILLVVLLAVGIQYSVDVFLSQKFPVHTKGVVLITGTSTGIGYHAVFELAKLNYTVYATVRAKGDLTALEKEAKERKLEKYVKPIIMDVTKSDHIKDSLHQISKFLDETNLPLVGIVNNAGVSTRYPLEIQPLDKARDLMEVNFFGAIDVTQQFLPLIRKHKGRILFISSISGVASLPGRAIYCASKRAIEGLVDSLRLEMIPFEVSVTSILPGYVKSAISDKLPSYKDLPQEDYDLYKNYLEGVKKDVEKSRVGAPGPEVTSEAIIDALTNPYPRTRYYMGITGDFPPWVSVLLSQLLPDPLIDYVKQTRYK